MFKNKVQDLIDHNILSFTEKKTNVKANLLPNHGNLAVNVILEEDSVKVVSLVDDLKNPWSSISVSIQKHGVLTSLHDNCDMCKIEPDICEKLKDCVQGLINQGVL